MNAIFQVELARAIIFVVVHANQFYNLKCFRNAIYEVIYVNQLASNLMAEQAIIRFGFKLVIRFYFILILVELVALFRPV